jgi:hypothetical protein
MAIIGDGRGGIFVKTASPEARLGFVVQRSALKNRIFIPKYYDPILEQELASDEEKDSLPWVTIQELVDNGLLEVDSGVEVGKMTYGTGPIPFIRTSDLLDWEVKKDIRHAVSQSTYDEYSDDASLAAHDILLVRDGTYLVGSSALVSPDDLPALFCGGLYRLRIRDPKKLSPYTLLAFLNLPVVRKQMRARQFTRDVIDTLGYRLLEIRIPSPIKANSIELAQFVESVMQRKA